MSVKSPNTEKLQQYLNETSEECFLLSQVKKTLENSDIIRRVFFENASYLPLLEEARKKAPNTFNTLTKQIEHQCGIQSPAQEIKQERKFKPGS